MAFTNIIYGTIGGTGNIISTDASFSSILSKFQVRYNGTGSWLECSNTNNITNKFNCSFELKLKDGETLTTMQEMFWNCSSLTSLDLSNLDTSSVTNMQSVFNNCSSLTSLNVSNFNTSQVTTMNSMFFNCSSLTTLDLSSFNTSQVTNMLSMFQNCSSLTTLDLSSFNTSQVTIIYDMFYNCPVSNIRLLYATSSTINSLVTQLGVSVARDVYYAITILSELKVQNNITYIKFIISVIAKYKFNPSLYADYLPVFNTEFTGYIKTDVDNGDGTITRTISHDTLKPTFMRFGVKGAVTDREKSLLEVIECDTSNITDMENMFRTCSNLVILDTSGFNTSKTKKMNAMFQYCSGLTNLDVSNFNTSQSTSMSNMFDNCSSLTSLDVSNFDTSNVTDMSYMFRNCTSLTSLDVSNFNTSNVNNMGGMFNKCSVSNIGLIYASSSTINSLLTQLGTDVARNIYYMDAPLNELTVQDNITYIKYEMTMATFPYTLNKLPNGVADYIDVVNKVHVQRTKTFSNLVDTFADSRWMKHSLSTSNTFVGRIQNSIFREIKRIGLSDKDFKFVESYGNPHCAFIIDDVLNISLPMSSLTEDSLNAFKVALANLNPTFLCELATPIYTPLTDEEIAQLPLSAYKDGYINLSSDQLLPSFEFRMKTSNRYQVDMLETGYYYLNAPVGNVKLGTANVDVQQMPCIVKVDNVGTGDSGYRLGFDGGETIHILNPSGSYGYWIDDNTGELKVSSNSEKQFLSDFIEINTSVSSIVLVDDGLNKDISFWDENKAFVKRSVAHNNRGIFKVSLPNTPFKFIRIGSFDSSNLKARAIINPITLAKLPSHRIPTSFTQGMKCGINYLGYWQGIIGARPITFRTSNIDDAWKVVESSVIEDGNGIVLNRIEYNNTIVEDELDIATGRFTKRIGKVILDGSSDESWSISIKETSFVKTKTFQVSLPTKSRENYICINNRIPFVVGWEEDFERLWIDNRDTLVVHTDKAFSVDDFRKHLASNPITVYYPLAVPEISYPKISSTQVKTVANTALQCLHWDGYLNAQCKPSHLTYPVPSLVGNRTYTVVHNRKNITGSTKPIELNLGGTVVQLNDASSKTLVKTPSTLAHNNLIFIGGESTVDHIMVLDGDWTDKPIEYFENMMGHDTDAIITIIGNGQIDDVEEQYLW